MGTKALALAALLLSSAFPARADEVLDRMRLTFGYLDYNQDGKVERGEGPAAYGWKPGVFTLKDVDGDGFISFKEYVSWTGEPRTRMLADALSAEIFEAMDGDGDGRLDRAEEWLGSPERFAELDADRDGRLDRAEAGLPRQPRGKG